MGKVLKWRYYSSNHLLHWPAHARTRAHTRAHGVLAHVARTPPLLPAARSAVAIARSRNTRREQADLSEMREDPKPLHEHADRQSRGRKSEAAAGKILKDQIAGDCQFTSLKVSGHHLRNLWFTNVDTNVQRVTWASFCSGVGGHERRMIGSENFCDRETCSVRTSDVTFAWFSFFFLQRQI